jgi:hypothetical protein
MGYFLSFVHSPAHTVQPEVSVEEEKEETEYNQGRSRRVEMYIEACVVHPWSVAYGLR